MLVPDVDLSHLPFLEGLSRTLILRHTERMMFILGLLLFNTVPFAGADDYCPLKAKKLGCLMAGRHLKFLRAEMIKAGLIYTNGYVPREKPIGYRLSAWILRQPLKEIPVSMVQARLINCYAPNAKIIQPPEKTEHLILWHNLHQLTFDPAARVYLNEGPKFKPDALSQRISTLQMIELRAFKFSVDDKSGRVFNNFTSIASDLRPYLRLNGSACAEVDVSASQLYILANLYPPDSTERIAYLNVVTSGRFYEELQDYCGVSFRSRKNLKVGVMVEILFGRKKHGKKLWLGFQRLFPELSAIMQSYHGGSGSALAIYLQRMEADVMISRVVPRLHQVLEGRPFLTLHDAIFCQASDADVVALVIAEEFGRLIGTPPSVKVKRCEIELEVSSKGRKVQPLKDVTPTPSGDLASSLIDQEEEPQATLQTDLSPSAGITLVPARQNQPVPLASNAECGVFKGSAEEIGQPDERFGCKADAHKWAISTEAFSSLSETEAAYEAVKAEFRPRTAGDMFMLWRKHCRKLMAGRGDHLQPATCML